MGRGEAARRTSIHGRSATFGRRLRGRGGGQGERRAQREAEGGGGAASDGRRARPAQLVVAEVGLPGVGEGSGAGTEATGRGGSRAGGETGWGKDLGKKEGGGWGGECKNALGFGGGGRLGWLVGCGGPVDLAAFPKDFFFVSFFKIEHMFRVSIKNRFPQQIKPRKL